MKHVTHRTMKLEQALEYLLFMRNVKLGQQWVWDDPPKHVALALQYAHQRHRRRSHELERRCKMWGKRRPAKP